MTTPLRRTFALSVCLLVALCCLSCSGGPLGPERREYTAQFRDTLGLYQGNDVTVLGYPVGKVTEITPHETYVDVTFVVDDDVDLPADVQAVVLRPGIVTDRALELTPAYDGGETLDEGAVIGVEDTRQPVEYDQILTALDDFFVALAPEKGNHVVRDATRAAARLLGGNGRKIRAALAGISSVSEIALHAAPDIQALLHDLNIVMKAITRHDSRIRRFSGNLAEVTSMFADDSDLLTTALATTAETLTKVSAFVTDNRALIRRNVSNATKTSRSVAGYLREMQEILVEFPLALENLGRAIDTRADGLQAKIAYQPTVNDTGALLQLCHGSPITFLCALTNPTGIATDPRGER